MKNLIFDLDGTLFQADVVAMPAFKKTFARLQEEGLYRGDLPAHDLLQSMFGLTLSEIWSTLMPKATTAEKAIADQYMGRYEKEYIDSGLGILYDGVGEVLEKAVETGKRLYIASNGAEEYVDHVIHTMQIAKYFEKAYSAGEYQTKTKVDLVARIIKDHQLCSEDTCMIGDRITDIEAGAGNQLATIGCLYGYAKNEQEFKRATYKVSCISEITKLTL